MEFFEDIIIPAALLQHPSRFDETEQAWIWEYDTGDGGKHDLFMDPGEQIRFKIVAENFSEISPQPQINTTIDGTQAQQNQDTAQTAVIPAYSITVS